MPESLRQALPIALECIEKNTQDRIIDVTPYNKERHMYIRTQKGLKYWMLFKRELFLSFGKIFNMEGAGESINKDWLFAAINEGVDAFIFVYQSGNVYIVPPKEFKDFAERNKTIRTTESKELTYSVPVKLLRRWK